MNILSLLKRFVPPYRWQVVANLFFNILSTILSLFSFATIIPVLQILFGLSELEACTDHVADHALMSWQSCTVYLADHTLITCLVMH